MHDTDDVGDTDGVDRRGFLGMLAFAATGIVAVAGGLVALVYAAAPALRGAKDGAVDGAAAGGWSGVPDASKAGADGPSRHTVPVVTDAGWAQTQSTFAVFLDKETTGKTVAFSARCPHEGCQVEWDTKDSKFVCPCHLSSWTRQGERIAGPTKRGLDPLEVRETQGGAVEVRYVTYALDSSERIQVG